ncbi:MAG: phosphatidylinositol N-acetylglucosaminyltransferase subunit gpi1 [Vezdaea aestivalis]|nr:MAG: phosphatidylinositol N-acetylglucosaminyltransferase subunit gpi1 [Vezdaea aestivalis]
MVATSDLIRVFWPLDAPRTTSPGVIVGWRNSDYDLFVVTILVDVEVRSVENALRAGTLYRNSQHSIARIFELCGQTSMQVLGSINPVGGTVSANPLHVSAYLSATSSCPRLACSGAKKRSVQVVMFDRPHPTRMQYISLEPISLALSDKLDSPEMFDKVDVEEDKAHEARMILVNKLTQHTITKNILSDKEIALPRVLNQINCSFEMDRLLRANIGLVGPRSKRSLSVSERVVESASTVRDYIVLAIWELITVWIYPKVRHTFIIGLICHRTVGEGLLRVLEWRAKPGYAALKDISATAQQVEIRLQQFCYWPTQYLTLRKRKDDWESVTKSHAEYIRFYNSLWLVANDVIIGMALGFYVIDNASWAASEINDILDFYTVDGLQSMISWLMVWPAGLKLNTELATFLGDLFLWVIEYWAGCVTSLRPVLPHLIWFIGFSSFAGASMPISLFSDLLSVLTLHIYSFYIASARIFNWQLTILVSLFHLFRGKKRNMLRNRIDSCDYDLDQLLLGTILFTLLVFLLPTVAIFYFTFASARMVIISLKATLDTLLACLNHFPLFALMLRIKDSRRLPGGIRFELRDTRAIWAQTGVDSDTSPTSYVHLKSVPLSFRAMFHQYFQLGHRLRKHYLSPSVILALATGRFVPPIHRKNLYSLQYSMLPTQRGSIIEMWTQLTAPRSVATTAKRRGGGYQPKSTGGRRR